MSIELHRQIYAAIKDKDRKLSQEKIREHFDKISNGD